MSPLAAAAVLLSVALLAGEAEVAATTPATSDPAAEADLADLAGTYRVHGTARVEARPLPVQDGEVHADVEVAPSVGPRGLALKVVSQERACALAAEVSPDGALSLAPGQRCELRLAPPDGRGAVHGVLRRGAGTIRDGRLALELVFDVAGEVSLPLPKEVALLGGQEEAWTPDLPIRGEARASAQGRRDASRAASQPGAEGP